MSFIDGKELLLTGGTGSLCNALVRLLLTEHRPRGIRIFSRDEWKQWQLRQQLARDFPGAPVAFLIGDVRDAERVRRACSRVDVIVHCAAMKHVWASESNPFEAIRTNIDGAMNVINAAIDCGVERVIAVSSDKAVNPINLYGSTKHCAEKLFIHGGVYGGAHAPAMVVTRYGNVLGSRGSILPLFREQAAGGGPILITHPEMTRFWISLPRVARFILDVIKEATAFPGCIFIPRMPSMKVVDIARVIAPGVEHYIIGMGTGEKLHETLISAEEVERTVGYPDRFIILPHGPVTKEARGLSAPYVSNTNENWLDAERLKALLEEA